MTKLLLALLVFGTGLAQAANSIVSPNRDFRYNDLESQKRLDLELWLEDRCTLTPLPGSDQSAEKLDMRLISVPTTRGNWMFFLEVPSVMNGTKIIPLYADLSSTATFQVTAEGIPLVGFNATGQLTLHANQPDRAGGVDVDLELKDHAFSRKVRYRQFCPTRGPRTGPA
jgi:hypothetical protein